jgi:uncharacterized iron-regulated protein
MAETMADHGGPNLPKAQALKDATMAHFMLQHYVAQSLLIHFNGAGHTDNYDGIVWYLKRSRPDLKYLTISTVSQKDISKLAGENKGRADFIICVDSDMTLTY